MIRCLKKQQARDEEACDCFCFGVQVRYAFGYRDLSEGHFDLGTVYNFRLSPTRSGYMPGKAKS
ncbi:MAG: hypothetical protein Kow0063_17480 [Anaerolineae bacterium]